MEVEWNIFFINHSIHHHDIRIGLMKAFTIHIQTHLVMNMFKSTQASSKQSLQE